MQNFIQWNSQPIDSWSEKYAPGKFIDLNGRKTHYIEKGDGEPIILLHGFYFDSYLWTENIDALAKNFKVYALDLWGCGYSTRENLNYNYQLYSYQLQLFMDSLGIQRASLIGQSMGGGTAISFCVNNKQRVNKLILVNSAGLPNPIPAISKFANLPYVGEFFLGLKTNSIRRKTIEGVFLHKKELLTDSTFHNMTRFHKIKGTTKSLLSIQRKDFWDKLSEEIIQLSHMSIPTLIVWGREDKPVRVQLGQEMHRILKGSRFEIIDDAGHISNFDGAEKFNKIVISFLNE